MRKMVALLRIGTIGTGRNGSKPSPMSTQVRFDSLIKENHQTACLSRVLLPSARAFKNAFFARCDIELAFCKFTLHLYANSSSPRNISVSQTGVGIRRARGSRTTSSLLFPLLLSKLGLLADRFCRSSIASLTIGMAWGLLDSNDP